MNAAHAPDGLAGLAHRLIAGLGDPDLTPILASWPPDAVSAPDSLAAASLPVLAWLPQIARAIDGPTAPLVISLARLANTLAWRQTYTEAQLGADFMRNYGYTEIIGLD